MRHLFHTDDCGISLICRCCRGPTCERRLDLTDIRSLERDLWSERTVLYFSKKDRGLRLKRKILSLLASGFKAALRQILALMEGLSNMSSKQNKRVASDLLTERTQVHRRPERACYDRNVIYSILDEALYCNIAFTVEDQPYAIPTIHTRVADFLYIHGSAANRMLRVAAQDVKLCVTVTLLDGLVLARSAFHHSLNYRSVMILGAANEITDQVEKASALQAMVEHIIPGRWDDVRQPNETELKATKVLRIALNEASAKIRTGPPIDDEEDYMLSCWAGEIPIRTTFGAPVPDPRLRVGITTPNYLGRYPRE